MNGDGTRTDCDVVIGLMIRSLLLALLAVFAHTTMLAVCTPATVLAVIVLTTVLADFRPTALLTLRALTTVLTD